MKIPKILKPVNPKVSEQVIAEEEQSATAELTTFIEDFQTRHNAVIVADVIFGVNTIRGIVPITQKLSVLSNKRFKQ